MTSPASNTICIGMGLRHPHYQAVLSRAVDDPLALDFLEVHAENFFAQGGAVIDVLDQAASRYPLSLHGVGLSLGSASGLDEWHLQQLKRLVDRVNPILVSDHACFGRAMLGSQGHFTAAHANDLLPIRHTPASLDVLCSNVHQVQETLGRRIAVENISAYLNWQDADDSEVDFLNALAQRTGCGVLLDLNNIYVNALNRRLGIGAALATQSPLDECRTWVDTINPAAVMEIHLAGYTAAPSCATNTTHNTQNSHTAMVIDDHATPVHPPVWDLYRHAVASLGHRPTLIEWDLELPELSVLLAETSTARHIAQHVGGANAQSQPQPQTPDIDAGRKRA